MSTIGIPIKLLHEGEGLTVTVELKNGEIYRGTLSVAEDSMNCQMTSVTMTARDGRVSKLEHVYLRGSHIKFVVLPDVYPLHAHLPCAARARSLLAYCAPRMPP